MKTHKIAIIGGGLSGLYTAYLLEQHGISDYLLIESNSSLGGRILTEKVENNMGASLFDLGPTWFWPGYQPQFSQLINKLNLTRFAQFDSGKMVLERSPNEQPIIMQGYTGEPQSMRLKGGMGALIDALEMRINHENITFNEKVSRVEKQTGSIEITCESGQIIHAEHIFLALPPRLLSQNIEFIPALPKKTLKQWEATPTWMAPHAKYVAVFETPFWREKGLSGDARSARGPMVEIHDASSEGGMAALFGFVGVPANVRKDLDDVTLKLHCRAQLERLFGPEIPEPKYEFLKDWSQDSNTATALDLIGSGSHGIAPEAFINSGEWQDRVIGVASEWSRQYPGLLAGAIEATGLGVQSYISKQKKD